jgi:UDP-3-O-[3-hydroxymyristoyl] glucosamine N-acyltransferase
LANKVLTLAQLAGSLGGVWHGNANHAVFSLSSLIRAKSQDIAYFDNPALIEALESTSAGVVLLKAPYLSSCRVNSIVVANPLAAMAKVAELFTSAENRVPAVHSTAVIHPTAQLGKNVTIDAYAVIGESVQLADGVTIGAHSLIESFVSIGQDTDVAHGVTIHSTSLIGKNVLINSGCVIGSTPFNYLKQQGAWQKGPALGGVIISDGVQMGANSVIDRGALGDTHLAQGVCLDNLVHIAHDVFIGANTAIAGCAAIGAHAQIGADCIIGGASCIAAFVHLTDDVVISGMSTVSKSLAKSGIYSSGTLVHEHQRWRRNAARFRRLDDYIERLGALERKISSDA